MENIGLRRGRKGKTKRKPQEQLSEDVFQRLTIIAPIQVVDLIKNTTYADKAGLMVNIFPYHAISEIAEAVKIYIEYEEKESKENALILFSQYMSKLSGMMSKHEREGTLIEEVTLYESPFLESAKRQENLKIALAQRRRVPVSGIKCHRPGCTSNKAYLEELFTRSGDEGGVIFYECELCGNTTKKI